MKRDKIVFWVSTGIIFLTQGIIEALVGFTDTSMQGLMQLGYPKYFLLVLVVFKILGSIALIVPQVPKMIKELAYAGFGFDFIFAFISIWVVGGFSVSLVLPVIAMIVLVLSYKSYHKLN